MALSRAQHEANKINNSYATDKWGNRVAPVPTRSHNQPIIGDITHGVRRRANNLPSREVMNDPLKLQIMSLRACGRHAEADRLEGIHPKK
ncbi:hypothetical protein [Klebsiella pneumoniae]|uniref:hypothetical protein n=1 Tax=Klebsiella pneumoniae TaxID=573 RepID=UPI0029F54560|nr:hypothetical protein [Klebsiella pneumoniae]MDX8059152.1 hypothetical protein [Klebsiella pneumoniae]